MTITLAELKLRAKQKADREGSEFIGDAEMNFLVNSSIAELHDLIISTGLEYFLNSTTISTVVGTDTYALPSDFYKLKGVDLQLSTDEYVSLRAFNFNERNYSQDQSWTVARGTNIRYRLYGNSLKFSPKVTSIANILVWYIPLATKLTADGDTLNDLNQFAEYIITDVAIKYLQKEESDVSILMQQKAELKRRIEIMTQDRDFGAGETVTDVYADNNPFYFITT